MANGGWGRPEGPLHRRMELDLPPRTPRWPAFLRGVLAAKPAVFAAPGCFPANTEYPSTPDTIHRTPDAGLPGVPREEGAEGGG